MDLERPDLSQVPPTIKAYIEALEAEIQRLGATGPGRKPRREVDRAEPEAEAPVPLLEPAESPTSINVITISANGIAKRTPRHLYNRQRRGGMGIFDTETSKEDQPAILLAAEEGQSLLLFTNLARTFRIPFSLIPETPIHGRGQSITGKMALQEGEHFVAALPDQAKGTVAMVSERGLVRQLRHHVFGEYMKPGTAMFDAGKFGALTAVCRTPGDGELLIATRNGKAIRFSEKLVPPQGGNGLRVEEGDAPVAISAVYDDSQVFLVDNLGHGSIRQMSGFSANKSAGGSGKIIMNTDTLLAAITVSEGDDIFLISQLSKIIRFMSEEVPIKEGSVQGVNCMMLRADQVIAAAISKR